MEHNRYISPFETRYASKEMQYIFSEDNKFKTWRRLWIALAKAEKAQGLPITQEQIDQLEAHKDDINYDVAIAREKEVRHDVMSHVYAYGVQCPDAKGIIHLGATSCYVGDNTDVILMREGLQLVRGKLVQVLAALWKFADEYKAIIARLNRKKPADYQVTASHTHYFRGDYSLHVRPQYNFDVRQASTRTKKCEYGNKENLKTYFMSDGCTNIVQTGDEYFNIFPVWNWRHIPGTTAPQVEKIPMDPKAWGVLGTSTYAGGVSDSIYGATAYAYMDTNPEINTGAKKSWYFFDNEVVCLGAGIQSTSTYPVHTTVNQCFLKDGILVDKGGKEETLANGSYTLQAPQWVLHDKIGYFFPQKEEVFLTAQTQSGRWYDINTSKSKKEEKMDVFTLGINHGVGPKDGSYAYIVVPGKTSVQEMEAYQKENAIEILSNNAKVQAVRNTKLNVWMMTFFEAGTFKHKELSVTVDKPCVLMVKDITAKSANLHIADPGQTQSPIQVELKIGKKKQALTADFSQTGIYAGATKQYTVKL